MGVILTSKEDEETIDAATSTYFRRFTFDVNCVHQLVYLCLTTKNINKLNPWSIMGRKGGREGRKGSWEGKKEGKVGWKEGREGRERRKEGKERREGRKEGKEGMEGGRAEGREGGKEGREGEGRKEGEGEMEGCKGRWRERGLEELLVELNEASPNDVALPVNSFKGVIPDLVEIPTVEPVEYVACSKDNNGNGTLHRVILFDGMEIVNSMGNTSHIETCSDYSNAFIDVSVSKCRGYDEVQLIFDTLLNLWRLKCDRMKHKGHRIRIITSLIRHSPNTFKHKGHRIRIITSLIRHSSNTFHLKISYQMFGQKLNCANTLLGRF